MEIQIKSKICRSRVRLHAFHFFYLASVLSLLWTQAVTAEERSSKVDVLDSAVYSNNAYPGKLGWRIRLRYNGGQDLEIASPNSPLSALLIMEVPAGWRSQAEPQSGGGQHLMLTLHPGDSFSFDQPLCIWFDKINAGKAEFAWKLFLGQIHESSAGPGKMIEGKFDLKALVRGRTKAIISKEQQEQFEQSFRQ